jgi:hypothetical protein
MEWLIWMLAIVFVMRLVGRGTCSIGYWNELERRRIRAARAGHWYPGRYTALQDASPELHRPRGQRVSEGRRAAAKRAVKPAGPKETPEERIRRRFVEGRIDLDQYEAELWEEIRPK